MMASRIGWIGCAFFLGVALCAPAGAGEDLELGLRIEPPEEGIILGRPFQLVFEAQGDPGGASAFPERPDLGPDLRVLGFFAKDPGEAGAPRRAYRVLPLRSGTLEVPPVTWVLDSGRACRTNRMEIEVLSPIPGGDHPPARPDLLMSIPREGSNLPWFLLPALLLAGAALAGFMLLRRKGGPVTPPAPEPPHLAALRALDRLGGAAPRGPEEWDAFYVALSRILRGYAGARFRVEALERTTGELDAALAGTGGLAEDARRLLRDLLLEADRVKFRAEKSMNGAGRDAIARARRFVESTAAGAVEALDGGRGGGP